MTHAGGVPLSAFTRPNLCLLQAFGVLLRAITIGLEMSVLSLRMQLYQVRVGIIRHCSTRGAKC